MEEDLRLDPQLINQNKTGLFITKVNKLHFKNIQIVFALLLLLSIPLSIIAAENKTSTRSSAQSLMEVEENGEDGASSLPLASKVTTVRSSQATNPIVLENQNPGTNLWAVGNDNVSSDSTKQIKGYADRTSVNKGETLNFKITVNPAQNFMIEIYRMGWYQGLGGRLMKTIGPIAGVVQSPCPQNSTTKMVECKWSTSYSLMIPSDWTTGMYLAKIKNTNGFINYINFTVRDDSSHSDLLLQTSTNTLQAYNQFGGTSLYPPGQTHGVKVSYDRPYTGTGTTIGQRELQMVRFLEREGYDVSYTTDVDTHERGNLILNHKGFLEMGHDEYWSWEMRDAVETARDKGVSLGFFGGNESYWQVRYEPSSSGVADRVLVGYKEQYKNDPYFKSSDPTKKKRTSSLFRYSFINRPEQLMMGVMYGTNLGNINAHITYTVTNTNNWIFAGTGVIDGQDLTDIVGKEYNRYQGSYPKPANTSFTIVSKSVNPKNGTYANSVIYQAPSGAWVFSAGTMDWSHGLDDYGGFGQVSSVIQQMTRNILSRFINPNPIPTPTPTPGLTPSPSPTVIPTLTPTLTPIPTDTPIPTP